MSQRLANHASHATGTCAVVALLHDVLVVWSAFAIFGYLWNWQIDNLFVTAMLTVIGFSVHDTIIIFDRMRENLRHQAPDSVGIGDGGCRLDPALDLDAQCSSCPSGAGVGVHHTVGLGSGGLGSGNDSRVDAVE